jgi:hypothetical protein
MKTLKNVLLINALSSGATGLLLALFPKFFGDLFGHSSSQPFILVGIFLIAFAVLVFAQSRKSQVSKSWLKLIIALDVLWVVESLFIVIAQLFGLSMMGYLLIAAVAAWVGLMAFLQIRGLRAFSLTTA